MMNNLLNNQFVKYSEVALNRLLSDRLAIVQDADNDIELIADAAQDLKEIKAVLSLFEVAQENEIEYKASTTGIQLVEMVTGKSWREMTAPSLGERASQAAGTGLNKMLGWINKGATALADKTKR